MTFSWSSDPLAARDRRLERVGTVQRNYDGRVPDLAKWFEGTDMQTIRLV